MVFGWILLCRSCPTVFVYRMVQVDDLVTAKCASACHYYMSCRRRRGGVEHPLWVMSLESWDVRDLLTRFGGLNRGGDLVVTCVSAGLTDRAILNSTAVGFWRSCGCGCQTGGEDA